MKLIIFIFSLLLIINGVSNGMEIIDDNHSLQEKVLYNHDILFHITEQVWNSRRFHPMYVGNTIRSLSYTNNFLYSYYSAEKNQQKIIRGIARNNYESDTSAAMLLHFHTVSKKIKYFIDIVSNKDELLKQEDLQDKWYLKATDVCNRPLAHIAIAHDNIAVAQLIIHHLGADLTCKELSRLADALYWKIRRTDDVNLLHQLQTFHSGLKKELLQRGHQ